MDVWHAFLIGTLAGSTLAGVAARSDDVGIPPAVESVDAGSQDAGSPQELAERVTLRRLHRLAFEYNCPEAPPAVDLADGGRYDGPERAAREDCLLSRQAAEIFKWRDLADAGTISPDSTKSNLWLVTSAVCALSGAFSAYATNRTARHLGLWP